MDFNDILKSQKYIQASSKLKCGIIKKYLYVENPGDRSFWEFITNKVYPNMFEVKVASQDKALGKSTLQADYHKLNPSYLVGIDSDYDYICPERNKYSGYLVENKYILHTFGYSRESLMCCIDAINNIITKAYYREPVVCEIIDAVISYSKTIHYALCVFSYLHNKDVTNNREDEFREAISITNNQSILDDELKVNRMELEKVKVKSDLYVAEKKS